MIQSADRALEIALISDVRDRHESVDAMRMELVGALQRAQQLLNIDIGNSGGPLLARYRTARSSGLAVYRQTPKSR